MVTLRTRGENTAFGETVQLRALFKDASGNPADLDVFPSITIVEPSGNVAVGPTSLGVFRLDTGLYGFDYPVALNASLGVWSDIWDGVLLNVPTSGTFNFVVQNTQLPAVNTDGYIHLGDDPGFCYSQTALMNINLLMKTLRARLDSRGKATVTDSFGNDILVDCDIFTIDSMTSFIANALTYFNAIPHFTHFTFNDTEIIAQFHHFIVQGASIMALGGKALLERGREFQFTDQGIQFNPPTVSELMQTEWAAEMTAYREDVKLIKSNMKPAPLGLGTFTVSTSRHPAIRRLRHLRARQLF